MKKVSALLVAAVASAGVVSLPGADAAPAKKKKKPITLKLKSGTAGVTFEQGFIEALVAAGIQPGPLAPGKLDGLTLNLPITGGIAKAKGKVATVTTKGGQTMNKPGVGNRDIINLVTKHRGSKTTVLGDAGGSIIGVDDVTFLRGKGGSFKVTKKKLTMGGPLTLSAEGAEDLNTNFGTTFSEGDPVGVGKVVAKGTVKK